MRISWYIVLAVCLCSTVSAALAEVVPVRVMIGTSELPLAPSPVHDGTQVLAPVAILDRLGATSVFSGARATITAASGQSGVVGAIDIDGKPMLPLEKIIAIIGGEYSYDSRNRTATLLAHLQSVEFDNDTLKINCSFPVHAAARPYDGKVIVDVMGTKLVSEAREVYIGAPAVERARLGQYNPTVSRVVLDMSKQTGYGLMTSDASAQVLLRIADDLVPIPSGPAGAPADISITKVVVQRVDDNAVDVVIGTTGRPYLSHHFSVIPPRIVLGVKRARVGDTCAVTGLHALVSPELTNSDTGVKVTLNLLKPAEYEVETSDDSIIVRIRPLHKSGGRLADKLIVIDPGHGGRQKGACAGGLMEKTLNVQLAKALAAALTKQGARAVLSRDSDLDMGLVNRARVATDQGADFFISLHCNSNVVAGSATGIETYYHAQEPSPKTLAHLIHNGVCSTTGMCDRRARSDYSLHTSGLGVLRALRGSGIPGILLECGYINNPSDRARLTNESYRSKVAAGIVMGIKAYIEGGTIQ